MEMPKLNVIRKQTQQVEELMGIDVRPKIAEGWFARSQNMTNDDYPILKTRGGLVVVNNVSRSDCWDDEENLVVADKLYRVIKTGSILFGYEILVYDAVSGVLLGSKNSDSKEIRTAGIGDRIVIFPDKLVFDCSTNEFNNIELDFVPEMDCTRETFPGLKMGGSSSGDVSVDNDVLQKRKITFTKQYKKNSKTVCPVYIEDPGQDFQSYIQTLIDDGMAEAVLSDDGQPTGQYTATLNLVMKSFELTSLNGNTVYADEVIDDSLETDAKIYKATVSGSLIYVVEFSFMFKVKKTIKKNTQCYLNFDMDVICDNVQDDSKYVSIFMTDSKGNPLTNVIEDTKMPTDVEDGTYWLDISQNPAILKIFSSTTGQWAQVLSSTYCIKLNNQTLPEGFKEYDTVTFHTEYEKDGKEIIGQEDLQGDWVISEISSDRTMFMFNAVLPRFDYEFFRNFRITRDCPDLDYICTHDNRIWGCNSNENTIYASKLGDPDNWFSYEDLSTDSYALEVSSPGAFTGCGVVNGFVLVFKENCIHRMYGTKPQNYALKTFENVDGVMRDRYKTISSVEGVMFYLGMHGVFMFDGSNLPRNISEPIGKIGAYCAAAHDNKYYIGGGAYYYVYDMQRSTWNMYSFVESPDGGGVIDFMEKGIGICSYSGDIYYSARYKSLVSRNESMLLERLTDEDNDDSIMWMIETGDIGLGLMQNKWISKIVIRVEVDGQPDHSRIGWFNVYVSYDGGDYKKVYSCQKKKLGLIEIPIIPARCDRMRIKMDGDSRIKFYGYSKEIEGGSVNGKR